MTAGNLHDGRAGHGALPNDARDIFADNGRRVQGFMSAVLTKGGVPKIWQASRPGVDTAKKLNAKTTAFGESAGGSCASPSGVPAYE
jgi:IS5 family transposase